MVESFREFKLTFVRQRYYESVQRFHSIFGIEIFKPNQIKLFLNLVLKWGIHSELYNSGHDLGIGLGNSSGVYVKSGTLYDHNNTPHLYRLYLWEDSDSKEPIVKIEYLGVGVNNPKVYAIRWHITSQHSIKTNLNNFNFDKRMLDADQLPKYINNPILGVYAKERFAGII